MLVALRDMSVGDLVVKRGETLTAKVQGTLPPGRIESLKSQRWVEEITDETHVARVVDELTARVEKCERRIDLLRRQLTKKETP